MIKHLSSRWNLVLVMLMLTSGSVLAQISVGAKVGGNLNSFSQAGTTVGMSLGAYGSYQVLPFLLVKLEPQYSLEGGSRPDYTRFYANVSDNISSIQFLNPSVYLHTVQVPLLVELSLPEFSEEAVKPVIILGLSYATLVSAKEMHTKRYSFVDPLATSGSDPLARLDVSYQRENVTDNYRRHQWSMWFGMGLSFKSGERSYGFDVRYRQGLTDLNQLRFASPGNTSGTIGAPGTGGKLYSSSLGFNFSMSIFNF